MRLILARACGKVASDLRSGGGFLRLCAPVAFTAYKWPVTIKP